MSTATETEDPSKTAADLAAGSAVAEAGTEGVADAPTASLGVERWVSFAFIMGALVVFWVLKNIIVTVWDRFDEPKPNVATAVAAVVAFIGAVVAYRRPNVHQFANDVAVEYQQVTWPTKDEALSHTAVVIVVSLVATLILAVFDLAWSSLSDLLYRA